APELMQVRHIVSAAVQQNSDVSYYLSCRVDCLLNSNTFFYSSASASEAEESDEPNNRKRSVMCYPPGWPCTN
ncbi:MAG: hypothetical protein K0U52_09525, partial [Gammaproteobacteria bacterium]|nr:hypothetical protein [Gammaproteobacteria bacterium]